MRRFFYGIFVAGGSGLRMGSAVPKQFLCLDGKPILQRAMERFLDATPEMKIITVLPENCFQTWKDLCAVNSFDCPQILVKGGITRFHSVRNALEKVPDGAVVAVHDGVRPLVSAALVREMISRMESCRALIPVLPVTDTLRSTDPSRPDPDRSATVSVQTPQLFLSEELKRAYGRAYDIRFTDDSSVASASGIPISFIDGEKTNLKITTPDDLTLAQAILRITGD